MHRQPFGWVLLFFFVILSEPHELHGKNTEVHRNIDIKIFLVNSISFWLHPISLFTICYFFVNPYPLFPSEASFEWPMLILICAKNLLSNINFCFQIVYSFLFNLLHILFFKYIDANFMCENVLYLNKCQRQKYHYLVKCEHF